MTTCPKKSQLVCLMVCCNDYRNGNFQGHADAVHLDFPDDSEMSLDMKCTKVADPGDGTLQLGRVKVPYRASKEWHGNWCWNSYWLMPSVVGKVLEYLIKHRSASHEMISDGLAARFWNAYCDPKQKVLFCECAESAPTTP